MLAATAVGTTKVVPVEGIMFCFGISPSPSNNTQDNSLNWSTNTNITKSYLCNDR